MKGSHQVESRQRLNFPLSPENKQSHKNGFPFSRVKCYWSFSSTKDQQQDEVSKPDAQWMER